MINKSLKRVMLHAEELGLKMDILKMDVPKTTTQQAADEVH